MRLQFRLSLLCTCLSVASTSVLYAANPPRKDRAQPQTVALSETDQAAKELIDEALSAEAEGDLVKRDRLLKAAASSSESFGPANWQRGLMANSEGQFVPIDAAVESAASDETLQAYEQRRAAAPETILGQWNLAIWCWQENLHSRARAHAQRIIDVEPNHIGARRMLGYQQAGDEWLSKEQVERLTSATTTAQEAFKNYGRMLSEIARDANHRNAEIRERAATRLNEITDPSAAWPIEGILAYRNEATAELAVRWLVKNPSEATSQALVRIALASSNISRQKAIVSELKQRPFHEFVPTLLRSLSSPVVAMYVPVVSENGTFTGFRQVFQQENQDKTNVMVFDTNVRYSARAAQGRIEQTPRGIPRPGNIPVDAVSQNEALQLATAEGASRTSTLQADNDAIIARNRTIASFLGYVADQEFTGDAKEIWNWWDKYNETEHQALKLSNVRYVSTQLVAPNYAEAAMRPTFIGECFVKGTEVMTCKGLRPVESIQVGDTVLSKNIGTGELAWQVVVQATRRQPRPTVKLTVGEEVFQSTCGHLFWVSGSGWKKASEMQAGDILHAASEPAVVTKVEPAGDEPTFNLQIEGTHTYFVGRQLIMSHDVTDRQSTRIRVPGLLTATHAKNPAQ